MTQPPRDTGPARPADRPTDRQRHVVVVEDDEVIRGIVTELLDDDGFAVTALPSGEAFSARLGRDAPPDVLIVDVALGGGMDGFNVAQMARRTRADLPVIFISGDLLPLVRSSGPRDLCLVKPFSAEALRRAVRTFDAI